jgi:ferredoxin
MPVVKFIKEKKEITVPAGATLRTEAIKAGINLNQGVNGIGASVNRFINCAGKGMCGTCRVNVKKGMENTNPLSFMEQMRFKSPMTLIPDPLPNLAYIGNETTMRLACCTIVNGDIEVESGPEVNLFGENFFS